MKEIEPKSSDIITKSAVSCSWTLFHELWVSWNVFVHICELFIISSKSLHWGIHAKWLITVQDINGLWIFKLNIVQEEANDARIVNHVLKATIVFVCVWTNNLLVSCIGNFMIGVFHYACISVQYIKIRLHNYLICYRMPDF